MKKYSKVLSLLLALAMILPGFAQPAQAAEDVKLERLAGLDRVETAIKVSQKAYDKADTVVLAGYNGEADALTGTILAKDKNAPMLLTYKDKLDAKVVAELNRLGAKKVYILGGETVVFAAVETALKDAGFAPTRLKGDTRVETAVAIANEVLGSVNPAEAFAVEYNSLADALAIGPVAANKKAPILITYKNDVPAKTEEAMKAMQVKDLTVVGGENVISPDGLKALEALTEKTVARVSGSNRELTSIEVANKYNKNPKAVVLANGYKYADALVGGYFAAMMDAPILLTNTNKIALDVLAFINEANVNTYVLGGETAVSGDVYTKVEEQLVVVEDLKIESVSAISAKGLKVTFNKEIDITKAAFAVKKGTIAVNTDKIEFAEDKMSATITTTTNLTKGDYTVSVTGLTEEALTGTVTVENEKVSEIKVAAKAPRIAGALDTATASYEVLNQYGEKMIPSGITWTASTGKNVVSVGNDKLTIENAGSNVHFIPGAKVYLTGVHANSGTVVNSEVEVVLEAQANTVKFKGVYDTTKGEMVNLPAGFDSGRYVLLLEVKDQYGNKISQPNMTPIMNKLVFTSNNPAFVSSTLAVASPTSVTIEDVVYEAIQLAPGSVVAKGGKVTIQAISTVTGATSSFEIDADALATVKTFSMSAPTKMVAEKETVEIPFTAVDQYGNAVTKYETLLADVTLSPVYGSNGLRFVKQNDGTAKLMYTAPATGATSTTDLPVYLTSLVTQGGNFSSLMLSVKAVAVPTTISGLNSKISQSIASGNSVDVLGADLVILDQYGREMTKADKEAWLELSANNRIVVTSEVISGTDISPFTVVSNKSGSTTDTGVNEIATKLEKFTIAAKTMTAGLNKTEKLVFALSTEATTTPIASSAKSFVFTNVGQSLYSSYEVEDLGTMYNDGVAADKTPAAYDKTLKVYGVLANGSKVLLPASAYTVTTDTAKLTVTNNVISDQLGSGYVKATDFTKDGKATDIKVNVLVTIKDGTSGAAADVIAKELIVTNKDIEVATIKLDAEKVTDGKATIRPANDDSINAALLTAVIEEAKDQYGVDTTEDPIITITKLVKVDGSALAVSGNGTDATSIANAAMGDKFTATFKYDSGKSVAVDFTVGIPTP